MPMGETDAEFVESRVLRWAVNFIYSVPPWVDTDGRAPFVTPYSSDIIKKEYLSRRVSYK